MAENADPHQEGGVQEEVPPPLPPFVDHSRFLLEAWDLSSEKLQGIASGKGDVAVCSKQQVEVLLSRSQAFDRDKSSVADWDYRAIAQELCDLCFNWGPSITALFVVQDYLIPILAMMKDQNATELTEFDVSEFCPKISRISRAAVSLASLELFLTFPMQSLELLLHGMTTIYSAALGFKNPADIVLAKCSVSMIEIGIGSVVLKGSVMTSLQVMNLFMGLVSIGDVKASTSSQLRHSVAYAMATTAFTLMRTLEDKIVTKDGYSLNYYQTVETYLNIRQDFPAVMIQAAGNMGHGQRHLLVDGKMVTSFDLLRLARQIQLREQGAAVPDFPRAVLVASIPWVPLAAVAALAGAVITTIALSRLRKV